jgi:hypothetical protein
MFGGACLPRLVVLFSGGALPQVVLLARAVAFPEKAMAAAMQFERALYRDAAAAGEAA